MRSFEVLVELVLTIIILYSFIDLQCARTDLRQSKR